MITTAGDADFTSNYLVVNNISSNSEIVNPAWLDLVREQVTSLRFGVVQIVVHNSQVVQVDKTERIRLERPGEQKIAAD